jgi:integrase
MADGEEAGVSGFFHKTDTPAQRESKDLVPVKKIRKGDKYFPAPWVRKLTDAADSSRDLAYVQYHIQTGLRVSDVLSTRIEHVEWQQCRTWTFDHKKDAWRHVYWPESLKGPLKMWLKERQNILEDLDREQKQLLFPFTEKTANRIIKRLASKIGFPFAEHVGSHWCRHTFIRLSRMAGRDIKAVQQNTGDTIKTLLEWYSDLSHEDMRREIEQKPIGAE